MTSEADNSKQEFKAFIVGLQAMGMAAGVYINVIGWLVGANYYAASLPFLMVSIFAPFLIRRRHGS